jgi:hypothetical protein
MKYIELPGGIQVVTYERPPQGFNPLAASDAELRRFGFPHRPQDPEGFENYTRLLGRLQHKLNNMEPTFRVDTRERQYPHIIIQLPPGALIGTSDIWSGGIVFPPTGDSFRWIRGQWAVPNVAAPVLNDWCRCWSWIGLDGGRGLASGGEFGHVCQAGFRCDTYNNGSSINREVVAWYEWWPGPKVDVTSFSVSPGDLVFVLLQTSGAGATEADVYFLNDTQGNAASFTFKAPSDAKKLVGDCAEWIVERPIIGKVSALADYGEVFFSDCRAGTKSGTGVSGGLGKNINMTLGGGDLDPLISAGSLITPDLIRCIYAGPWPPP